jgi:hypothetical protein
MRLIERIIDQKAMREKSIHVMLSGFPVLLMLVVCCSRPAKQQEAVVGDFSKRLQTVPAHAILEQEGYYVWGGSVVRYGGQYHMYYSRWPLDSGFSAWVTHSEIAHAVADDATGPYRFVDVALPARGAEHWDGLCTHNPNVHRFDGRFYLYYMGNTGDGRATTNLNFVHRNNQRVGVAWADDPAGPWTRMDDPVIDVSEDSTAYDALMTSNPSATRTEDGRFLLIYKAVAKHAPMPFGGPVTHLVAIADHPAGPFVKRGEPVFYREGLHFPAEDPYIWWDKPTGKYLAIVKDNEGTFTGKGKSLALFTSENGLDWEPAEHPYVSGIQFTKPDGSVVKLHSLERPQLLFEGDRPIVLFCAADTSVERLYSFNVHIPLAGISNDVDQ